ncbi:sensor histidine kinase [Paenibacillus kandeliae]|uniref:sensor histidine kinase n=1 Tax=Paenibacillus kandeliae TaxID=3231269 RepID=UPI0034579099
MREGLVTKWKNRRADQLTHRSSDIFKQTRGQLTRKYSLVLISFLLLFVMILYGLLYDLLIHGQQVSLRETIEQKIRTFTAYRSADSDDSLQEDMEYYLVNDMYLNGNLFVGTDGSTLMGSSDFSTTLNALVQHAQANQVPLPTQRNQHILLTGKKIGSTEKQNDPDLNNRDIHKHNDDNDEPIQMLVTADPVIVNGQMIGILYVGQDVTESYRQFYSLLLGIGITVFLFCTLAVYFSSRMAKRAMIPIAASYERQRAFTADASHELRTPLSVLLSSIETIQMEEEVTSNPFINRVVQNMKHEVQRMTQLSSSLLMLARSDSGHIQLHRISHDLNIQAQQALSSVEPLAKARNIQLDYHNDEAVVCRCDAERVHQLLIILLDNAIKYTPEGGKVALSLQRSGEKHDKAIISVQDTGIGISQEDQALIFDRFYRVDPARNRQTEGYGLGLSIARWIVEAHHGTIQVRSTPGEGSCFIVTLPL